MEKIFDEFREKVGTLGKNLEFLEKNAKNLSERTILDITACVFKLQEKINLEIYRLSVHKRKKIFSIDDFANIEIDEEYIKEKKAVDVFIEEYDKIFGRSDEFEEKIEKLDKNHEINAADLNLSVCKLSEEFKEIFINLKKRVSVLQKNVEG